MMFYDVFYDHTVIDTCISNLEIRCAFHTLTGRL